MKKDYSPTQLPLIDQLRVLDGEMAAYAILRMHTWPAAILTRVAVFMEIGANMHDPLSFASRQLKDRGPSKTEMISFIQGQYGETTRLARSDQYRQLVLPKTNIHIVDLSDPFRWDSLFAGQWLQLVGDLARNAYEQGVKTSDSFGDVMSKQGLYVQRCSCDINNTLTRLFKQK